MSFLIGVTTHNKEKKKALVIHLKRRREFREQRLNML